MTSLGRKIALPTSRRVSQRRLSLLSERDAYGSLRLDLIAVIATARQEMLGKVCFLHWTGASNAWQHQQYAAARSSVGNPTDMLANAYPQDTTVRTSGKTDCGMCMKYCLHRHVYRHLHQRHSHQRRRRHQRRGQHQNRHDQKLQCRRPNQRRTAATVLGIQMGKYSTLTPLTQTRSSAGSNAYTLSNARPGTSTFIGIPRLTGTTKFVVC
jgi:Pyruvate/2-oxoacid:ferredoxin oxidoreductase delta subunit